jgi:hypothetical protein
MLNVKYNKMWLKMKILLTWQSKVHALVNEEFLPASLFHAWESGEHYTLKNCIHNTSSTFSILNLQTWIAGWHSAAGLMQTPI